MSQRFCTALLGRLLNNPALIELSQVPSSDDTSSSDSCEEDEEERDEDTSPFAKRLRMEPTYECRNEILNILDDEKLVETFRFDKRSIMFIAGLVDPILPKRLTKRKRNLTTIDQVLMALQYFATGDFQNVVGDVLHISQSSVSRSIHCVAIALCILCNDFIYFPEDLDEVKSEFKEIANMESIVGAVNGIHIQIKRPVHYEEVFLNQREYHSLFVQGICDAHCKFLAVDATKPGSTHKSRVLKESSVGKDFAEHKYGEGFLIGDREYPCTSYMLTPFSNPSNDDEERYNFALKSTKCTIDHAFRILEKRFSCLRGKIRMDPGKVSQITLACCVLHNIALDRNQPLQEMEGAVESVESPGPGFVEEDLEFTPESVLQLGQERRNAYVHTYFSD